MSGMNTIASRLQIALCRSGCPVTIDRRTLYSRNYGRMLTKYTVKRRHPETGKILDKLESYKLSDVIQYLAELYREEAQRDQQTEGLL